MNPGILLLSIGGTGILTFISLIAAAAEEEGTGIGIISIALSYLYEVLRFPTHTLFGEIICTSTWDYFFAGLAVNCIFYGMILERLFTFIRK